MSEYENILLPSERLDAGIDGSLLQVVSPPMPATLRKLSIPFDAHSKTF